VEFLADHDGSREWRALHPHELPGMTAESRRTFGTTRAVATKHFNDIIVMAGETWVSGEIGDGGVDVSYGRNECLEPSQVLIKAAWIDELCAEAAGLEPVPVPAGIEVALAWEPGEPGETSTARAVVRNISGEPARDVTADLTVPFALRAEDTRRRLGDLERSAKSRPLLPSAASTSMVLFQSDFRCSAANLRFESKRFDSTQVLRQVPAWYGGRRSITLRRALGGRWP
jgi:hypothetical protein